MVSYTSYRYVNPGVSPRGLPRSHNPDAPVGRERRKTLSEKLLTYLVEHNLLTQQQADQLRKESAENKKSIRELLAESGAVTEEIIEQIKE